MDLQQKDYLAVAATRPALYAGVPMKLIVLNMTLSTIPGHLISNIFFAKNKAGVFLASWVILFCIIHRLALHFTRKDIDFMSVIYTDLTKVSRLKGASYWKGQNTYKI